MITMVQPSAEEQSLYPPGLYVVKRGHIAVWPTDIALLDPNLVSTEGRMLDPNDVLMVVRTTASWSCSQGQYVGLEVLTHRYGPCAIFIDDSVDIERIVL